MSKVGILDQQQRVLINRHFSEDFKKSKVKELERNLVSISDICKTYSVSRTSVYRWIYRYSVYNKKSVKVVEMNESGTKKVKDLETRIKELERVVGQKQLTIDYLEKMIDLAKEKFDIDIKKNSNTPRSNGSKKTDQE